MSKVGKLHISVAREVLNFGILDDAKYSRSRKVAARKRTAKILADNFPIPPEGWVERAGEEIRTKWGMLPVDERRIVGIIKKFSGA